MIIAQTFFTENISQAANINIVLATDGYGALVYIINWTETIARILTLLAHRLPDQLADSFV